ncbi:hypothetical protein A0H81_15016 [Grifola frondosa]|uniref:Uncharacterized protein n=1 Tax=Grifola frondosa TaxID=5627 RepID=A0A1C7LL69_GRIFR|nr:hypothetical protein A0H81_15016 [Grifola frondosa]
MEFTTHLSCIPKQLDSSRAHHKALVVRVKDGILTLYDALFQETCTRSSAESTSPDYNSDGLRPPDFKFELFPLHSQLLGNPYNYHTESRSARDGANAFQRSRPEWGPAETSKVQARPHHKDVWLKFHDTQTGMLLGIPRSARCVQRFDDSLNSAIHITYRISLRSSSMREPRDPLLKVV